MMIKEQIETTVCTISYKSEIMYIEFKKDSIVELFHINEIIEERCAIQHEKKVLTIVDIRNLWQANVAAREKAASPAMTDHNIALAILSDSLPTRILGNFYMKFNKPNVPTKMFDSEAEALEWLNTFK